MSKLGYLVPEWPAQTHAFFAREVAALEALGNEVVLLSTRKPPRDACKHPFAERARADTHYLYPPRMGTARRRLARAPQKTREALAYLSKLTHTGARELVKNFGLLLCAADLAAYAEEQCIEHVHVHSCATAAHLAVLALLLGGPGYSLTLHGDLPVYGVDHALKMKHARFVAAVTRPLKQQIVCEAGVPPERVPIIQMGVDTARFAPLEARAPARPNSLLVATVARLNPVKGHSYVLDAMLVARRRGLDVRYLIAGEGPHRDAIERHIAALSLGPHVELLGATSEHDVLSLLQRVDAFVLASEGIGEAAPVSVMEAMAAALPVISSRIGGTPDMISDGVDGFLIAQRDVEALTRHLEQLAHDVALRQQIGGAARKRAIAQFDYHAQAKHLHDAIQGALLPEQVRSERHAG